MSSLALAWIVAAAALAAAAGLAWRLRVLTAQGAALAAERARIEERLEAAERRFEERAKAQRKRGEEVAELRRKLEKARKRAAAAREERSGEASRLKELEQALSRAESERLRAQRALDALQADLERRTTEARPRPKPDASGAAPGPPARGATAVHQTPAAGAAADRTPAAEATAVHQAPAAGAPAAGETPATRALAERAEKAEGRLQELEAELASARKEAARHKRRATALDTAYRAQHGELEAKKDRLRTQQEELERLRALRVALGAAAPPGDE